MDVGMEEDRIGMTVLAISSDAVAVIGTAIVTVTDGNVDAAIAIVIGTAAGGKLREEPEAESRSRKQEQELFACSCFLLLLLYSAPAVYGGILDTLQMHSHNDLPSILRMWRNWQTRRSQKPVMVTSWRFKSSHPHQIQPSTALKHHVGGFSFAKIIVTNFRRLVFR
jgi:hypothetical protein